MVLSNLTDVERTLFIPFIPPARTHTWPTPLGRDAAHILNGIAGLLVILTGALYGSV